LIGFARLGSWLLGGLACAKRTVSYCSGYEDSVRIAEMEVKRDCGRHGAHILRRIDVLFAESAFGAIVELVCNDRWLSLQKFYIP